MPRPFQRSTLLPAVLIGGFGAWPILAMPGIPPERVRLLRDAFAQTMKHPDFLAEAKKNGREIRNC